MKIEKVNTVQGLANFLNADENLTDEFYVVKYEEIDTCKVKVRTSDGKSHDFMTFDVDGSFELSDDLTEESSHYLGTVMKFVKYSDSCKWFVEPRYNIILIGDDDGTYSFLTKGRDYRDNLIFFVVTGTKRKKDAEEHSLEDEDSKFTYEELASLRHKRDGALRDIINMSAKEIIE